MSLFLRGLKRIKPLALRFGRWLWKLFLHILKHPIKSVIWFVKVYLLLMLFALLVTFSLGSHAAELNCEAGETPLPMVGGCGVPSLEQTCELKDIVVPGQWGFGSPYVYSSVAAIKSKITESDYVNDGPYPCSHSQTRVHHTSQTTTISGLDVSCPAGGLTQESRPVTITKTTERVGSTGSATTPLVCTVSDLPPLVNQGQHMFMYRFEISDEPSCPDTHPIGPVFVDDGVVIGNFCYRKPSSPPCDCSDLNGESSYTYQSLITEKGTYTQSNQPQCLDVGDGSDPDSPACLCQIIAGKWFVQPVFVNGQEMDRWKPLPTPEQDGQSGIFTGHSCAGEEETPPAEKENCVIMKNGQKYCTADKSEKCVVINGVQQCQSGCGTINGEFVCVESDEDNPDDPLEDPDDNITDPDKPLNDMTKDDFKEINKGIESRLDIIAQLMQRNTDKIGAGTSAVTSKIDGTNKLLGDIKGTLEGIADELSGDGEGDGVGGVEYSTDILEEFVNPNDWEQKNFQTVATAFKERMQQAPVINAVQQFFEVSFSGSCPTWSTTVDMPFGGQFNVNIDQLCSDAMTSIWPMIRAIIILIFSFLAFRVAFTNG